MTTKPSVSVLMTAYNREQYLAEAIQSVLDSTYQDFELIIVDDGSTDRTVEIARGFEEADPRVAVHINEKNLGDYPNRNRAASHARGEYLKYVDADDYLYPTGLEVLVGMMSQFPDAGYGLCSLDQDVARPFPFSLRPVEAYRRHYFETALFHKAPLSSIIRRSAFDAVGGFPPERMVSDCAMWHKLSRQFDVVLMPFGPVWYREHDSQEVNAIDRNPLEYALKYENVTVEALTNADCPLEDEERYRVIRRLLRTNKRRLAKCFLGTRFGDAMKVRSQIRDLRDAL